MRQIYTVHVLTTSDVPSARLQSTEPIITQRSAGARMFESQIKGFGGTEVLPAAPEQAAADQDTKRWTRESSTKNSLCIYGPASGPHVQQQTTAPFFSHKSAVATRSKSWVRHRHPNCGRTLRCKAGLCFVAESCSTGWWTTWRP